MARDIYLWSLIMLVFGYYALSLSARVDYLEQEVKRLDADIDTLWEDEEDGNQDANVLDARTE